MVECLEKIKHEVTQQETKRIPQAVKPVWKPDIFGVFSGKNLIQLKVKLQNVWKVLESKESLEVNYSLRWTIYNILDS